MEIIDSLFVFFPESIWEPPEDFVSLAEQEGRTCEEDPKTSQVVFKKDLLLFFFFLLVILLHIF